MIQFFALLSLMVVSYFAFLPLLKYLIDFLVERGVVDTPSDRRMHNEPVPRGAGLAMVVLFPLYFFLGYKIYAFNVAEYSFLILGLVMVAAVSWWDDIHESPISIRLAVHLCAAFIMLRPYLEVQDYSFILMIIGAISLAGFANIYNFLDGMDGITAFQTIHLSLILMVFSYLSDAPFEEREIILIFSSLCLVFSAAFLKYNIFPAKLFLGDVGSITLGFMLGYCFIVLCLLDYSLIIPTIIANLYYFADGVGTLAMRLLKGEKFWLPHLNHCFQKAMQSGMTPPKVMIKIIRCNVILALLAIAGLYWPVISLALALIATSVLIGYFMSLDAEKRARR